jgi:hypothetical protein
MQSFDALVSGAELLERSQGAIFRRANGEVFVRTYILFRLWRVVARSGQVQMAEEVDKKVRRRFRDIELDSGEYERVSQVSRDYRKKWRMQSHDMQESSVSVGVLLGVFGAVGTTRLVVVQL